LRLTASGSSDVLSADTWRDRRGEFAADCQPVLLLALFLTGRADSGHDALGVFESAGEESGHEPGLLQPVGYRGPRGGGVAGVAAVHRGPTGIQLLLKESSQLAGDLLQVAPASPSALSTACTSAGSRSPGHSSAAAVARASIRAEVATSAAIAAASLV